MPLVAIRVFTTFTGVLARTSCAKPRSVLILSFSSSAIIPAFFGHRQALYTWLLSCIFPLAKTPRSSSNQSYNSRHRTPAYQPYSSSRRPSHDSRSHPPRDPGPVRGPQDDREPSRSGQYDHYSPYNPPPVSGYGHEHLPLQSPDWSRPPPPQWSGHYDPATRLIRRVRASSTLHIRRVRVRVPSTLHIRRV